MTGTISQIGQINISALNVPGGYVQIVPPQFLFSGVPTSVLGMVGTASWGPTNAPTPFSNYTEYATIFGPTVNRLYDMGAHVLLSGYQGGNGRYQGVRATDGTDTAATGVINATGASAATGSFTFTVNPTAAQMITLNGSVWTFVSALTTGLQILLGASLALTLSAAIAALQATADANTKTMTYGQNGTVLFMLAAANGVGGNALTISTNATGATASGSTLSGGAAAVTGLSLTGRYSGSLGNSIGATISQGTQSYGAVRAAGQFNFTSNPTASTTIGLNGSSWSFVSSGPTGNQILLGSTLAATLANILIYLAASVDTNTLKMTYALSGNSLVATSRLIGTVGNTYTLATNVTGATTSGATLSGGAAATATYKLTLTIPGVYPEQFDNIGAGLTGNALWVAFANAVNNGNASVRGPSNICIATAGSGSSAPLYGTTAFTGGTDGVTSITSAVLIGVQSLPRTGMYALYGSGSTLGMICDLSDSSTFSLQAAFGLSMGCYMIGCTAAGDTLTNAQTELGNAGIDTFSMKIMFGDWIIWNDTATSTPQRLTSPQSCAAGVLMNLSPQGSSLNKPISGIVGTQKSMTNIPYQQGDLQILGQSGMDVIANPSPGGSYFSCQFGKNTSSNQVIFGDEYTRVTYFLAASLLIIAGYFVGEDQTSTERLDAITAMQQFLQLQVTNGIVGNVNNTVAYFVDISSDNNSNTQVALGYQTATIQVTFLGIVRYFIVNLQGGSSVIISATPQLAAA